MKNYFFIFSFIGLSAWQNSNAQANIYHPFPDSGAEWNVAFVDQQNCLPNPCGYQICQLGKDTIYNGTKYSMLLTGGMTVYPYSIFTPSFSGYFIRNDTLNKEVFIAEVYISGEKLLYDFNLKVGDTLPVANTYQVVDGVYVTGIDSILLGNGTYRKRFKLNSVLTGSFPDSLVLIEGIGYTGGLLQSIVQQVGFEGGNHLACFQDSGIIDYNFAPLHLDSCNLPAGINQLSVHKNQLSIYPNPTSNRLTIISNQLPITALQIENVLGQILIKNNFNKGLQKQTIDVSTLPEGIYFYWVTSSDSQIATGKFVKE